MLAISILFLLSCVALIARMIPIPIAWSLLRKRNSDRERDRLRAIHNHNATTAPWGPASFRVSILKPLCGADDELEENIASFAEIQDVDYELILSLTDLMDPALEIANRVRRRFPDAPFSVVIGAGVGVDANPKVERLIAAARVARNDILLISDSNVRVAPQDISRTVEMFSDPSVGCVANLFVGDGASNTGAVLECLHLLGFVFGGSLFARAFGATCVVGKSMAIRRDVLEAIGGFEKFTGVLAEDQAMALAIRAAGYRVVVAPPLVRNVVVRRTVSQALSRQIRWNKIRYSFSRLAYTAEFLSMPVPLAIAAMLIALFAAPHELGLTAMLVAATCATRILQMAVMSVLADADLGWRELMLTPVQELLQFAAHFVAYFSNEVDWRDHRIRLGAGTQIIPARARSTERVIARA